MTAESELHQHSRREGQRQTAKEIATRHASPRLALFTLLAIAVALAAPCASRADDLPAATLGQVMQTITPYPPGPILEGPGLSSFSLTNPGFEGGTATATTYASYADGTATIVGSGTTSGEANVPEITATVGVSYSFEIVGPESDVEVPIIISASASTSVTGKGSATVNTAVGGDVLSGGGTLNASPR